MANSVVTSTRYERKNGGTTKDMTVEADCSQKILKPGQDPSTSEVPHRGMKSKESKAGKKAASTRPNENHLRVNFLHHAAQLLFSQSVGRGDALSKLGSTYIRHMSDVCLMEHIKVDREIGRTLCAKCKRVFVSNPDSNCHPIRMRLNKKKQVVRTCLDCGTIRRFTINRNYLSRNEKTQLEMTSCGSREAID
uniref:ALMS motif domain-containing protein n=1 Tax=Parascaris univalens TaxID=6257 RepID=A0A915A076_PARUN